jgi:hypothetical protein
MKTRSVLLTVVIIVAATLAYGGNKPNFSGEWKLDLAKSDLGGAPIDNLVVRVEHRDPVLTYTVKGSASGEQFEETESITTDGKPGRDSRGATLVAHWDGDWLVLEATDGDGKVIYISRVTVTPDGKTMTRVFERKSADDPQTRHEVYEKIKKPGDI